MQAPALIARRPDGLVAAMARGRLPYLQTLVLTEGSSWYHFHKEPHRPFLINTISSGALPRLTFLSIEDTDSHLNLMLKAFLGRAPLQPPVDVQGVGIDSEDVSDGNDEQLGEAEAEGGPQCQRHQAMIERLVVHITKGNHRGVSNLLEMPCFGRLQCLEFLVRHHMGIKGVPFVRALATYIRRIPGFAPCLRHLSFQIPWENPTFGPLLPLFLESRPPGLTHLTLSSLGDRTMNELGDIYMAGGLAKLKKLEIASSSANKINAAEAWMAGVVASKHKGAALKELILAPRCSTLLIIKALERGAFPKLETLSICLNDKNMELLHAFIMTMRDGGAPCAQTLRTLNPGWGRRRRDEYIGQLRNAQSLFSYRWPKKGVDVTLLCVLAADETSRKQK